MAERIDFTTNEWYYYGWEHVQRYNFVSQFCKDKTVLDVGCGIGYGSFMLKQFFTKKVVGIDLDPTTIKKAIEYHKSDNIDFFVHDAMNIDNKIGAFDIAVSFENIEHLPNPIKFIESVSKILVPEGLLIISAPNKLKFTLAETPILNEYHLSEPTYEELKDWLSKEFDVIGEYEQASMDYINNSLLQELVNVRSIFFIKIMIILKKIFSNSKKKNLTRPNDFVLKSEIIPLLPYRREICTTFLFVCKKKS